MTGVAALFDVIMIVDWSANAAPKTGPDSIWISELEVERTDRPDAGRGPYNASTRARALAHLTERLHHHEGRRVLLGCDVAFGYPAGFAVAAGLIDESPNTNAWEATWLHLAAAVEDDERNRNNRWEVAATLNERMGAHHFWGVPAGRATEWLAPTRPQQFALPATREADRRVISPSGRRPFSVWQLLGAGAVGSQTLTGIPALQRLRGADGLQERIRVWPFETCFTTDPCAGAHDAVVLAEVWPSSIVVGHIDHPVKDARQVVALAHHLAAADAAGRLPTSFSPVLPPVDATAALSEEGWVLHA